MQSVCICPGTSDGKCIMSELLCLILEQQCASFQDNIACFLLNPIWDWGMCLDGKAVLAFLSKGLLFLLSFWWLSEYWYCYWISDSVKSGDYSWEYFQYYDLILRLRQEISETLFSAMLDLSNGKKNSGTTTSTVYSMSSNIILVKEETWTFEPIWKRHSSNDNATIK